MRVVPYGAQPSVTRRVARLQASGSDGKALVRAAGRAAIEEALLAPEGVKRKGGELTREKLTAEWAAYAEVSGVLSDTRA